MVLYYGPKTVAQAANEIAGLHKTPATFIAYPPQKNFTKVVATNNKVLFANYDMVQAEIYWVRPQSEYNPAKTPEIDLFNNYFGNGMNTIVFQTIRESKALAYSTYAQYSPPAKKADRYTFVAYVGTQADKLNESIKSMNELLNNDLPDSEKGIATARDNIRKSIETQRITEDGIILSYLGAKRRGIDYDERKNTFTAIEKLNYSNMKAFHTAELKDKPYTYCIIASDKKVSADDLKKYGELVKPDMKQVFGY